MSDVHQLILGAIEAGHSISIMDKGAWEACYDMELAVARKENRTLEEYGPFSDANFVNFLDGMDIVTVIR